jgi:hypothetical protein
MGVNILEDERNRIVLYNALSALLALSLKTWCLSHFFRKSVASRGICGNILYGLASPTVVNFSNDLAGTAFLQRSC